METNFNTQKDPKTLGNLLTRLLSYFWLL